MKAVSYELVKELLERLKVLLSLHDSRVDIADAWNISMEEARSTIAKVEAEITEAQSDADGWIKWEGGACPVSCDVRVELKFRSGQVWIDDEVGTGSSWDWSHDGYAYDIIAYRTMKGD